MVLITYSNTDHLYSQWKRLALPPSSHVFLMDQIKLRVTLRQFVSTHFQIRAHVTLVFAKIFFAMTTKIQNGMGIFELL